MANARQWIILSLLAATPAGVMPAYAQTQPASTLPTDSAETLRSATANQSDRDEAARRLIGRHTPEANASLLAALKDPSNRGAAQRAAARAIPLDLHPDPSFIQPLFDLMSSDPDDAATALAGFRDNPDVESRLITLAADSQHQQHPETRIAAIKALGSMTDKQAAATLVSLVTSDAESPAIRNAAADTLVQMTGISAGRDAAQWQKWWTANSDRPDVDFSHDLLETRAAEYDRLRQQFGRVVRESQSLMSEVYQSVPEKSREQILLRFLHSSEPETRLVGVQLVHDDFVQARAIPASVRQQLRGMVGDSSSQVRVAVAQALFVLNDPGAVAALLQQLRHEPNAEVRSALAEALAPTQDPQVIQPLISLLGDPSPAVAEVAADGLAQLGPIILTNQAVEQRTSQALRQALDTRTGAAGSGALRAAIVGALGAMKDPNLREIFIRALRVSEPIPVRKAAIDALGKLQQPWAADIIINSLDDDNDEIRLAAVNALNSTANFSHAERLYGVLENAQEKPEIRQLAWEVLRNRCFVDPMANNAALSQFADRFKDEPEKRIDILKILLKRLTTAGDLATLAAVRQNIGEDNMKLADAADQAGDVARATAEAEDADAYFEAALQYYRSKSPNDQDQFTSLLLEQRMDALLLSRQYDKATQFAADAITKNPGNQESMGRKIRNEADRLRGKHRYREALQLIDSAMRMKPALAEPYAGAIRNIEADVRQRMASQPAQSSAND